MQNQEWDFRDGQNFYFFESKTEIRATFGESFSNVEVGEITEELMQQTLAFYVVSGEKNRRYKTILERI